MQVHSDSCSLVLIVFVARKYLRWNTKLKIVNSK